MLGRKVEVLKELKPHADRRQGSYIVVQLIHTHCIILFELPQEVICQTGHQLNEEIGS